MDETSYIRVFLALLFVVALIGGLNFLLRRLNLHKGVYAGGGGKRLSVVEAVVIDPNHKVVLIRRDDKEHLVILGSQSSHIIESGIACDAAKEDAAP